MISRSENAWLDALDIPTNIRQKTIRIAGKRFRVDAFDPNNKIIYEFWGDIWHGNPDIVDHQDTNPKNNRSYKELYDLTNEKRETMLGKYRLVEIWENDWKKHGVKATIYPPDLTRK